MPVREAPTLNPRSALTDGLFRRYPFVQTTPRIANAIHLLYPAWKIDAARREHANALIIGAHALRPLYCNSCPQE